MNVKLWVLFTSLLVFLFSTVGWLIDPVLYAPHVSVSQFEPPLPDMHTVWRPGFGPVESDVAQQDLFRGQGRVWALTESNDPQDSVKIAWVRPTGNVSPSTAWQRLIRDHMFAGETEAALSLCRRVPVQQRPIAIVVFLQSMRYQKIPMDGNAADQRPTLAVSDSDALLNPSSHEFDEKRKARHNLLKTSFLESKRNEIRQALLIANELPADDAKAEALDAVRNAFIAVDAKKESQETLMAMEQLLDEIAKRKSSMIASIRGFLAGAGRWLGWPLVAALSTGVLAVWQQIATHYTKKAIRATISDPDLAEVLGENLRRCGIILPQDFSDEEREIAVRTFARAGAPNRPR